MHIPNLVRDRDRFELAVIGDPSRVVREGVGDRFGIPARVATAEEVILTPGLDAVMVASPNAAHASTVLAALDHGLHVFVEKPLAITLEDIDRIIDAEGSSGRVVQVGYQNRFDPAYERLVAELPDSTADLRYVSVLVHDPESDPYFSDDDLVRGSDIPADVIEQTRAAEAVQVQQAVGRRDPDSIAAFSGGFLGSLVHQVNMVHGMLERMAEPLPPAVIGGDAWAGGGSLTGSVRLANGSRWDSAWIQLMEMHEYDESIRLYFRDSVRTLAIPSPWLRQSPSIYTRAVPGGGGLEKHRFESYREAYQRELVHFHACISGTCECRTPPSQARPDQAVLTEMFRRSAG
jgi:predicted dehydrogenase